MLRLVTVVLDHAGGNPSVNPVPNPLSDGRHNAVREQVVDTRSSTKDIPSDVRIMWALHDSSYRLHTYTCIWMKTARSIRGTSAELLMVGRLTSLTVWIIGRSGPDSLGYYGRLSLIRRL